MNEASNIAAFAKDSMQDLGLQKFLNALKQFYNTESGEVFNICVYKNWIANYKTYLYLESSKAFFDKKPTFFNTKDISEIEVLPKELNIKIEKIKPTFGNKFNIGDCGDLILISFPKQIPYRIFVYKKYESILTFDKDGTEFVYQKLKSIFI